ncbi:MAG: aldehyde reductase [Prosthecochloris sp.]|uniref:NAD-dependent epimerase/dehydratase n=1 Tax=Prosthecochloris aestuarii (strain DSM 271 / SK 413) TaxID=290512 RepID=B4S6H7_PROA2|nr:MULTISPECIES: aldehyde reductase [Prosthecochloris]ACF45732.1 NAD-dependent epimerase/dehydratase [Prosthecochloris aestuarii DSM 271]MCW8798755.1 aldehyde reductase [Prosthecochloris sp.]
MAQHPIVCVTGATGFIAAHLIKKLLQQGYAVRGTVRKLSKHSSYRFLENLDGAAERLELIEADLLSPGSFDAAIGGTQYVMHTASPYLINVRDPQKNLVEPALEGTRSVLESCRKASSVKRVVLTSSIAAITGAPDSNRVFTENDWNTTSSLKENPYHYSKTLAERAAWEFMQEQPGFDLVVINPFMVIGPSLGASLNTTNQMIRDIITGVYPGILDVNWGFVDVRDVALAHIRAIEKPAAHGRYLCSAEALDMRNVVAILRKAGYGNDYKLPSLDLSGKAATTLMKLVSWSQPRDTGAYLRTHLGRRMRYDNDKIRKELDIQFRNIESSLLETVEDLISWGHLKKKS